MPLPSDLICHFLITNSLTPPNLYVIVLGVMVPTTNIATSRGRLEVGGSLVRTCWGCFFLKQDVY